LKNNIENEEKSCIKILSYNIQRLPHLLREQIDINNFDYDIICFQEYFFDLLGSRNRFFDTIEKYNYCIPGSNLNYFVDSGLVILSKYKINMIEFVSFKNSCSIDKYSQKGFLVVKISDIYVINTHLQSCYNNCSRIKDIIDIQLEEIKDYIIKNKLDKKTCLIIGDLNKEINKIYNFKGSKKIVPLIPTLWDDNCGKFSNSTPICTNINQEPKWYDGGFLYSNKYKICNVNTKKLDDLADHLAVSLELRYYTFEHLKR